MVSASCVGSVEAARAGAQPKIAGFELQGDGAGGERRLFQLRRDAFAKRPQDLRERRRRGLVLERVVSAEIERAGIWAEHGALVDTAGEAGEVRSDPAITRRQLALAEDGELADQDDPVGGEPALQRPPYAPQQRYRLVGEKSRRVVSTEDGKAARLVQVRGDFGEKLAVAEPDRQA